MFRLLPLTFQRARKERLLQVAGSLSFTSLLSVVPLLAVSFALFTRVPAFQRLEQAIEAYMLQGLLPADISRTVLKYLNQFAANAGNLTWVGSLFLLVTAVALLHTVENALNQMWRAKRARPFFRRIGMYLLVLAVAPPLLGLSLWASSWLLGASVGLLRALPPSLSFVLDLGPPLLGMAALTGLYRFVPNAPVRWTHAALGGALGSAALELGKRGFAAYLVKLPTYKAVYGTFAVAPLFLLWVYFSWLVLLLAGMITAHLGGKAPQATTGKARRR